MKRRLRLTAINIIETHDFHFKTVLVDDDRIADGSFNWLSASRDEKSDYHNHEVTFIAKGLIAKPLIE